MSEIHRNFSHIYVEEDAFAFEDTARVLERFSSAEVIQVSDYKRIFNRPKQDFRAQKQSLKLILGVKKDDFLYEGSPAAPDFGYEHFYYNTLAMNCLYDCSYCYLQGMYPSANLVLFVNNDDYLAATDEALQEKSPLYLCLSYDTDLLALESIIPFTSRWIEFARSRPKLVLEVRTKSAAFSSVNYLEPCENVVFAWTLSPNEVVAQFEPKTPSFRARLKSAVEAVQKGWKIRLCFDPVLKCSGWESAYSGMIEEVFAELPSEGVRDVSIGVFRMNPDHFKTSKKRRLRSPIFHGDFERRGGLVTYSESDHELLSSFLANRLSEHLPQKKISIVAG